MTAILRRELSAYFHSPLGYIFLGAYYVFAGFYFFLGSLLSATSDLSYVFGSLFSVTLFLIPILTMRLLSEERRHKTDQALLTAPVTLTGLVLGKYLSAVLVYLMGLSVTLVFGLVLQLLGGTNWVSLLGNYFGLLLLGMALIAIGMFISSLTESQVIAATGGFAIGLLLLLIDGVRSVFQSQAAIAVVTAISFYDRYATFTSGIFDLSAVVFFISVCVLFNYLTIRVFDKRRWG